MEKWADIPGLEGRYQASNLGRIRSLTRIRRFVTRLGNEAFREVSGRILKTSNKVNGAGYAGFSFGHKKSMMVHTAVCLAFNGPCRNRTVNHKNFDKLDNRSQNLEWVTHKNNCRHAWAGGRHWKTIELNSKKYRGVKNPKAKITEEDVIAIRNDPRIGKVIGKEYGIAQANVSAIKRRLTWNHIN